jgi:hypothetical protein
MNPARRTKTVAAAVALAAAGTWLPALTTPASASTTCTSPVYKRQFYANTSLSGIPKKTDCDTAIDQNWGTGAPASGLPRDNFSVRWSVTRDFGSGGPFALPVAAQDGIRVYLDGTRKVDLWKNVSATVKKTVNITVPAGRHTLRVDFANWTGTANVSFAYKPRTSADVDKVKPLVAPTGLRATLHDDRTELRWDLPEDSGQYNVYRRTDGGWMGIGIVRGDGWDDIIAPAGKASYYVVAVDDTGAESAPSAEITVDRLTPATRFGPAAPRLTLDFAGILARSPVKVTARPGAGDEGRVLKGYSWEIDGACGDSGSQLSTTGDISWTPPYNGPCTATVYAVDAYGRQGTQSSSVEFFVGR